MPRPDQVQALVHAIRSTADMIVKNGHVSHGLDLSQAQRFSLEKMVRTYEREMLKILAQTGRTARREGVTDLRTRLEHIFREIWDQRTLLGTVTDWFRELNTSSNVTRDSVSNLRESMLQRIGQQEQTIIQEQQALENRLVSREQRLLEQSEHLIANHAGELNLRLSQMENELLRLNQVNSHLSNQLQVISARVSSVAANQWVILQRLSFKERLLSLWRRLSDRRVEPPYQPQVKTVYQDTKEPEPHPKSRKEETDASPVIRRYPVFCFPIIDWGYRYQRPQHLLSRFAARGHQVYYFTAQMSIALERYSIKPLMENIVEVRLSAPRDMNIYISQLDEGSLEYLVKSIEELVREQELKEVVMLVQFPFWQPLAEVLKNKNGWKLIYDCMDEHTGFEIIGNQFAAEESALLSHSDLVTVSSQKLLEKSVCNSNNYLLLPNAAEFDHFHDPQSNGKVRLSRPVLGYFGALAEWFDYDTIIYAAQQHPEWNFLIVGGHHSPEVENLKNLPNLMLTGEVSYQDLPGYLYYFDICLIPMRITPLIEATNPVKFFEYMAAGKPIVAADLPELRPYQELYYCYHDHDDFIEKVKKALEERDPALVEKRLHTARKNHWDDRFETLRNGIENLYPLVSIIITSYNNLAYLKQCLDSVYSNSIYPRIEVIVVDNASQAETVSYLKEKEGERDTLQVIYNQKNVGFARANNQGMKLARGDYFALLNDDVVVTLGWLSGLLHYFKNGDVGMVGPVTNSAGNEACIPVPYRDLGDMEAFARDYTRKNQGKFFEIDVLAFFCTIISRRVWEDVGSLDEQFEIGMFEDDDYALRVKQRGLKLICAQDVFVHHFGRASFSRLEDAAYKELFNRNKQRFEDKWARPWSRHKSL
jgi:GT2 family glycosyltransferase